MFFSKDSRVVRVYRSSALVLLALALGAIASAFQGGTGPPKRIKPKPIEDPAITNMVP